MIDNGLRKTLTEALAETPISDSSLWVAHWGRYKGDENLPNNAGMIIDSLKSPVNNGNDATGKRSRVILVHGRYGSGKSSFLELIRQRLKEDEIICHWIDMPSLTSHIESTALAAVMASIVDCLRGYETLSNHDCMNGMTRRVEDLWRIEGGLAYPCHQGGAIAAAVPEDNRMAGTFLRGDARRHVQANTLEKCIDDCLHERDKQMVVFLDDLDRCERKVPVDVVRLLLRFGNTHRIHFVLACDWDVLEYGVQEWMKHHGMDSGEQPLVTANSALEKYIHWSVELPGMGAPVKQPQLIEKRVIPDSLFKIFSEKGGVIGAGGSADSSGKEPHLYDVLINALLSSYGPQGEDPNER